VSVRVPLPKTWYPKFNESIAFYFAQQKAALEALNTTKNEVVLAMQETFAFRAGDAIGSQLHIDALRRLGCAGHQPVSGPLAGFTADPTSKDCILVGGVYLLIIWAPLKDFEAVVKHDVSNASGPANDRFCLRRAPLTPSLRYGGRRLPPSLTPSLPTQYLRSASADEPARHRRGELQVALEAGIRNFKRHGIDGDTMVPFPRVGETHKLIELQRDFLEAKAAAQAARDAAASVSAEEAAFAAAIAAASRELAAPAPALAQAAPAQAGTDAANAAANVEEADLVVAVLAAALAERSPTVLCRARQHGFAGGCELVEEMLEEPLLANATYSITYLSLLPMQFHVHSSGAASDVSSALPHFVEVLATRAIGMEGFASGAIIRSPPGKTISWASYGMTVASLMRAMARDAGYNSRGVEELLEELVRARRM
jgi:hypothetical protein